MRAWWIVWLALALVPVPAAAAAPGVGVLLDPVPDAEPGVGALSPMSLGMPNGPMPLVAHPMRLVVGPDGRQHAGGVSMAGVTPMPVHPPEDADPPDIPKAPHRGHVDLRDLLPPVRDQGAMGACVGFGFSALVDFLAGGRRVTGSPLALWGEGRLREGTFPRNEGIYMTDGAAILNGLGGFPEAALRYPEGIQRRDPGFPLALRRMAAPGQYEAQGLRLKPVVVPLQAGDQIVPALDAGRPVVIAIFEPPQFDFPGPGGTVETAGPNVPTEDAHCLVVVGYDDPSRRLIVRNSWGPRWGDRGHCYMSYDYIDQGYIFQAFTLR
ncbi:MAG: Phage protein [Cyanobacteria bacterium RYN_339]|nr:Phage protein [Cyanobacteria bacterium RYN_339]